MTDKDKTNDTQDQDPQTQDPQDPQTQDPQDPQTQDPQGQGTQNTGGQKSDGDGAQGNTDATGGDKGPEEELDLKIPEGASFSEEALTKFKGMAGDLKLSSEGAQKLLNLAAEQNLQAAQASQESWKQQVEDWKKSLAQDPEFGRTKHEVTLKGIDRALRTFGDAELANYLQDSGLLHYPPLTKMLARIADAVGEDGSFGSKATGGGRGKAQMEDLYTTMDD